MIEQLITITLIAVVLGMDALSLAMGIGLRGVTKDYERKFSLTVGALHVLMPLLGLNLGLVAGRFSGVWATRLGALVLLYLGLQMLRKGYAEIQPRRYKFAEAKAALTGNKLNNPDSWASVLFLGFSVSIDALTVGFTLGTLKMPILITVLMMGIIAAIMTWAGFAGGRVLGRWIGSYAQIFGGVVLLALAIKFVV
ncbi:MAG: manganese efflux pump MntP family protein [Syntrophomonas sp.]|uniref:manganese efflux pump MntP n=1 Tax=Syntrophomonas sp. TaxID=2053627 RepID=UPI0026183BC0|nr:manganese efflux pump MntP family protein [Syntrophomonas sp.]MDD2509528.1 manganese efflux pump MntP family protein [Syntrophomonas sp.]MDD3878399.1 manganese efflux pump MntP family protein [Syntrophomonas sp.]MDD4625502.1 manganese efflux pump MntP family protein [Syntrophomonas sp.]